MPLTLPTGLIAVPALGVEVDDVISTARITSYRFELLDNNEALLGQLATVEPGGTITWDAYAAVKAGGSVNVTDPGTEIDWLNVRVRPWLRVDRAGFLGEDPAGVDTPLGVYLCSAPTEEWKATGRSWKIELLDKLSILDQDVPTDSNGNAISYVASKGSNVITLVKDLITGVGESVVAIQPGTKTLPADLVWEAGTTRLKIINDLLDAANYFSLWCDGLGQYRVEPYVEPLERPITYSALMPFSNGPGSLMEPDWNRDRDIYSIPNRYVCVGQGSGDTEALVGTAMNTDPTSPFSYPSRGRWITTVETGVEAASQADLTAIAKRRLSAATSVTSSIEANHIFLPQLTINSMVRFFNEEAGLDSICAVLATDVTFQSNILCKSRLREMGSYL